MRDRDASAFTFLPAMGDCYLLVFDRKGQRRWHLVRYRDDVVVMNRKEVEEPLNGVRHIRERLGQSQTSLRPYS